ncbi:MAG: 4-hydroxybenzoate octaprenyltransferase [Phycisphaerales bacterium JB038]
MPETATASQEGSPAPKTPMPATGVLASLHLAALDIKLAHSVFALPFALLASFLAKSAEESWLSFAGKLVLIVGCMVTARTWAMLFNRLADRKIDARNPRTARRAVASGALGVKSAWLIALGSGLIFVLLASGFWFFWGNAWPPLMALPVLGWIAFYSLTKRFTWLCHLFLGGALAASPLAAALAIEPTCLSESWPYLFAGMVLCWVAGFDMIYALQDVAIDQRERLHSAPSRLGIGPALWCSRVLHFIAIACLIAVGLTLPQLAWLYWLAVAVTAGLLLIEHVLIARSAEKHLDMAFFTLNGVVSCLLGAAVILDVTFL